MNRYCPKVSIIIPAYNASNYLGEAIDSALAQTYPNTEIIVVNDGSRDDGATRAAALKYGDRIRYFEKENGGCSSALNYGIRHMTGQWFSWLSHDDLYLPEKIQTQIDFLRNAAPEESDLSRFVLFTAYEFINEQGTVIRKSIPQRERQKAREINGFSDNHWLIADQVKTYAFHACSGLIHKGVFEEIGLFDESFLCLNDFDMLLRIFMNHYKICYLPDCLVRGRVHRQQVSRSIGFSYHTQEQDRYWDRVYAYLRNLPHTGQWEALMLTYAATATEKTRWCDGKRAFEALGKCFPQKRAYYTLIRIRCLIYGGLRTFAKKAYIRLFM